MLPYYIMIGVPALTATFFSLLKINKYRVKNIDKDKVIIDSFFIIWLILLMFRNTRLGTDLPVYEYHFRNYSALSWKDIFTGVFTREFEASFSVLSKVVSFFTKDFQVMLIVCALISVIPIWILYRKNAKYGYLMVILFVNIAPFVMYFSGLRQAIAMAFVVPCYYYCKEKKLLQFIIIVLLAYLAHNSAFILLVMYPLCHWKIKKTTHLLYIVPLILLTRQYSFQLFNSLLRFAGNGFYEEYGSGIKSTGAYAVFLLLVVILLYSYIIVDVSKLDNETIALRNILMFCVIIQGFSGVHTLAMRMNYYFLLFVPILIPKIINKRKEKYSFLVLISLICMILFFTFYYFYEAYTGGDALGVYPYISMFAN